METSPVELKEDWTYSIATSLSSRTRTFDYTLVGRSNDNKEVSSTLLSIVQYNQLKDKL